MAEMHIMFAINSAEIHVVCVCLCCAVTETTNTQFFRVRVHTDGLQIAQHESLVFPYFVVAARMICTYTICSFSSKSVTRFVLSDARTMCLLIDMRSDPRMEASRKSCCCRCRSETRRYRNRIASDDTSTTNTQKKNPIINANLMPSYNAESINTSNRSSSNVQRTLCA